MATVPPEPNPSTPPAEPTTRPDEVSPPQHDVDVPDPGPGTEQMKAGG